MRKIESIRCASIRIRINRQIASNSPITGWNARLIKWHLRVWVEIIYVAVKGDGKRVFILPQTSQLLIPNLRSHFEFVHHRAAFDVEDLAALVPARRQQFRPVRRPRTRVNTAAVRLFDFPNQFGLLSFVDADYSAGWRTETEKFPTGNCTCLNI